MGDSKSLTRMPRLARLQFGAQPLAADLRDVEQRQRAGGVLDLKTALAEALSLR